MAEKTIGALIQDQEVQAAFLRMRQLLRDPKPVLREIGRSMVSSTRFRFRDQVSPGGDPWKPSLRALEDGGQTMRETSRLERSITYVVDQVGVAWGTNVAYARQRQFGGPLTAKRAKFLAIPITREARLAGSPRLFPRKLAYVQSLRGQPMLLDAKTGEPQYLLRKSVVQVARPYLGISHLDRSDVLDIVSERLKQVAAPQGPSP